MTKETTGTAPTSSAPPNKQALLEAFDSVLKKQAEDREAEQRDVEARRKSRNRVRPTVWGLAGIAIVLCTYLYIEKPEWLYPSTVKEPVAVQEASLRIGMANVAQHIERFRQRTGKLPRTLIEAGTQVEGIAYEPLDSADWRLIGTNAQVELTLASSEPLPRFLGNSFEVISRRSR